MGKHADLIVREATPADLPAVIELMKASLGEGDIPRDPAFFAWKHHDNPFGRSPLLLAVAGTRIVGMRTFMRWTWRCADRSVRAVRAVDTATHPDFQGKGIFKRLTLGLVERMRDEGVAFVFNTPNGKSMPGYLKMGWSLVGRLSLWVRPRRPLRIAAAIVDAHGLEADDRDVPGADGLAALLAAPGLHELLGSLRRPAFAYSTERTLEYLRWRYEQIPGFTYGARLDDPTEPHAAVIYRRRRRRGLSEVTICELLIRPGMRGTLAARSLLGVLSREQRCDHLVALTGSGRHHTAALLGAGFLPAPRLGPHFTVRPLVPDPGLPDPIQRTSWSCSIGDLELF